MFFELIKMKILRTFWQNFENILAKFCEFWAIFTNFSISSKLKFYWFVQHLIDSIAIENVKTAKKPLKVQNIGKNSNFKVGEISTKLSGHTASDAFKYSQR